jgi:hypothetical protein
MPKCRLPEIIVVRFFWFRRLAFDRADRSAIDQAHLAVAGILAALNAGNGQMEVVIQLGAGTKRKTQKSNGGSSALAVGC